MKILIRSILFFAILYSFSCSSAQNTLQVKVNNPNSFPIQDALLEFGLHGIGSNFKIKDGNEVIPYQVESETIGEIKVMLTIDLKADEEKLLRVEFGSEVKKPEVKKPEFKNRTYAGLSMKQDNVYFDGRFRGNKFVNVTKIKVPSIHKDHDALFRCEGPCWESEKVGYRFYLDWRNAIDIFGKKKDQLVLSNVGVHDTVAKDDSYHSMQDWGMDIFKVGNSLGIGSFGMWHDGKVIMVSKTDSVFCEITKNGPLKSEVMTNYYGWKVGDKKFNLESKLSIIAGSRLTKNEINISGDDPSNIVTGLAKYEGTEFFKSDLPGEWSYIAMYGNQTLVSDNDKLGIALIYRSKDLEELTGDELSYVLKLKPVQGKVDYYFCAAWEQEEYAVKNISDFKSYLKETLQALDNPPIIEVK